MSAHLPNTVRNANFQQIQGGQQMTLNSNLLASLNLLETGLNKSQN